MTDSPDFVTLAAHTGVLVATVLAPAIDSGNADRLLRLVTAGMDEQGRRLRGIVLDLTAVDFINSRGLAACIELAKTAERHRARAAVTGLSENLTRMFEVMRVDRLLPIAADHEAARRIVLGRDEPAS